MGSLEYLDRCAKRTRSVVQFAGSEEFYESILVGPLSSIPRWKYARALEAKDIKEGVSRTAEASAALVESTSDIIRGGNCVVQHFIDREEKQDLLRLSLYAALMRTALYLSEKNDTLPTVRVILHVFLFCWISFFLRNGVRVFNYKYTRYTVGRFPYPLHKSTLVSWSGRGASKGCYCLLSEALMLLRYGDGTQVIQFP